MAHLKEIAWFKSVAGRGGGTTRAVQYFALRTDGTLRMVDVTNGRTGTVQTMVRRPNEITVSNKAIFDYYYNAITKRP